MSKKEQVRLMFNDISGKYDFLNHFLSLGVDYGWRRKFVQNLSAFKPLNILDVATGTGDLAIAISSLGTARITGIDLATDMLAIAEKKVRKKGLEERITFRQADAEAIPFPDDAFDAVTVAFGVRNYEDLEKGLSEMRRVLSPGGVMMILEFSHPSSFPMKQAYGFYSRFIIPVIGRLVSKNEQAYSYLPESVAAFPSGNDFLEVMHRVGMKNTTKRPLTFGISTIYKGEK
ncbi:MAG: bifunctional demethylmenaquinone methyltransferase/2-methoxy-6-polyprenyl-1,4-benzoquinol methylase UbiE [Bacteroidetes bacterium]|nr:bifunctional demethylmenaquinone methyltransferase/2-methoxy-6-polyprenyl-1,4-benzoquinol methylase UbiE [Bacteroidota bacterium]